MAKKATEFKVGDKVAYSRNFLQSTVQLTGKAPSLRGEVKEVLPLSDNRQLCTVAWDGVFVKSEYHDDGMARILNCNLVLKDRIHLEPV